MSTLAKNRRWRDWVFKKIDARIARYGELTDEEMAEIIQRHRARA